MRRLPRSIQALILASAVLGAVPAASAQQQITQTVTKDNKSCNNGCSVIDIPDLNGNASAVLFVTPSGNSATLNPHPIGAYYMYLKKWSVFNLDGAAITEGATFSVEYYAKPDATHFAYVASMDGGACIDNAGLNNNANAQVRVFPTNPPAGGALFNKDAARAQYTPATGRWCLSNVNGRPVPGGTAYNLAVGGGQASTSQASTAAVGAVPQQGTIALAPATLVPQLAPLTVVVRTEWQVPRNPPVLLLTGKDTHEELIAYGDCRAIVTPFTSPAILTTDTVIITGHSAQDGGEQLTWTGSVENGVVHVHACNTLRVMVKSTLVLTGQQQPGEVAKAASLVGKTVNILVVR